MDMGGTNYSGSVKTLNVTLENVIYFKGHVRASFIPHQENCRRTYLQSKLTAPRQFGSDSDRLCTLNNKQLNSRSGEDENDFRCKGYLVKRRVKAGNILKGF